MPANYAMLDFVAKRISGLTGVESVAVQPDGAIKVVLGGGINRRLREEALDFGRRAMLPVHVFYRMPDGSAISEEQVKAEAIEDYYTPLNIPGFMQASAAPIEKVAAEKDGALRLKRIRAATRGRPVVAWKVGENAIRRGTEVAFKKSCALPWTMGRTLNIQDGAKGRVTDLSTRRPSAYLTIGGYDGVELPLHSMGHLFDLRCEEKQVEFIDDRLGYLGNVNKRLITTVGFGQPVDCCNGYEIDREYGPDPYIPPKTSSREEDMISSPETMDPSSKDRRFKDKDPKSKRPKLVLGRKR